MPGSDLDVAEVDAGVEHGRHEGVAEHVRVHPGDGTPRGCEGAGDEWRRGGPSAPRVLSRIGPAVDPDCPVYGPADGRRERDQGDLVALAVDLEYAVAMCFTEGGDVGAGGLEDSQSE